MARDRIIFFPLPGEKTIYKFYTHEKFVELTPRAVARVSFTWLGTVASINM
jgi:hypothetical protein